MLEKKATQYVPVHVKIGVIIFLIANCRALATHNRLVQKLHSGSRQGSKNITGLVLCISFRSQ